jgi:hypothetical protein
MLFQLAGALRLLPFYPCSKSKCLWREPVDNTTPCVGLASAAAGPGSRRGVLLNLNGELFAALYAFCTY